MADLKASDPPEVLPRVYAPFLPVLEQLSPAMQKLLHGQLLQFERFARAIDRPRLAEQGDFEGLGGLATRGDMAQLVQSELLLRTEAPLEFLRRIAEHEALYLEKVFADPGATTAYRAVVSVGPGLLGHGRLIALAALFFLARVAMQRDARLQWCFLPRTEGAVWFDGISVNTIKRFLKAASYREMTFAELAESRSLWERLQPHELARPRDEISDWVIGAVAKRGPDNDPLAAEESADALLFDLQPPKPGEPRVARFEVRQHGKDRGRTDIVFPDDRVCLSALTDPFRRPKAGPPLSAGAGRRPAQEGWEPRHFLALPHARLVRVRAGLLILIEETKGKTPKSWLLELPELCRIAGVSLDGRLLSIVVQTSADGGEALVYCQFHLSDGCFDLVTRRSKPVISAHLFRNQAAYALPPLHSFCSGVELCTSSGQRFRLDMSEGEEVGFQMLYDEPKTLYASGAYRVVRIDEQGVRRLRVLKGAKLIDEYVQLEEEYDGAYLGLVYAPEERGLAYCVAPGRWEVPRGSTLAHEGAESQRLSLRLDPHELLLSATPAKRRVSARIWSDASYGGDGTVRLFGIEDGVRAARQATLNLGDDALAVVAVKFAHGSYWALAMGSDGTPSELLSYRYRKRVSRHECTRFDLDRLSAEAAVIPAETFDD